MNNRYKNNGEFIIAKNELLSLSRLFILNWNRITRISSGKNQIASGMEKDWRETKGEQNKSDYSR